MGKKWRNEFFGWNITDYLRVFGLVLNTNRTNLGPPRSPCLGGGLVDPRPSLSPCLGGGLAGPHFYHEFENYDSLCLRRL